MNKEIKKEDFTVHFTGSSWFVCFDKDTVNSDGFPTAVLAIHYGYKNTNQELTEEDYLTRIVEAHRGHYEYNS